MSLRAVHCIVGEFAPSPSSTSLSSRATPPQSQQLVDHSSEARRWLSVNSSYRFIVIMVFAISSIIFIVAVLMLILSSLKRPMAVYRSLASSGLYSSGISTPTPMHFKENLSTRCNCILLETFIHNFEQVRRCDEMERKLRFLEKEIKKDEIPMLDTGDSPEAPQPREMIDLEATFEKLEHELREVNQNAQALKKNFLELTELKHILRKTQQFFDEQEGLELEVGAGAQLIQVLQPLR